MGTPVATNIMRSNALIYYAPEGETVPDETSVDAGDAWGGNWARIGYTAAPLTLTLNEERGVIVVEEELMPIDQFGMNLTPTMTTELAELIADYLALLFGGTVSTTAAGASQKGYEELGINPTGLITKYAVGIEGSYINAASDTEPVRIFAQRATFQINGDLVWSKKTDTYVRVPIMIQVLGGVSSGSPLTFQRVTAEATS